MYISSPKTAVAGGNVSPFQFSFPISLRALLSVLLGNGEEQLELWRQFLFGVESVGEVQAANAAIRMQGYTQRLDVICSVRAPREIGEVELDLIPTLVQTHRHRANEWLYSCSGLIVGGTEASANALVIEHLHFEREVLLQVLDDHDEEGKLDAEGLICVCRARDEARVDVATD